MTAGEGRGHRGDEGERPVVYCLIPPELASKLHELLRAHFREDPGVEVVVEQRRRERRRGGERRRREAEPPSGGERRQVRATGGRRVGERRAAVVPTAAPELPRRARRHAEELTFVERREPSTDRAEDLDTARVVARYQAGDQEAFGTLYTRYFDRVYGYLRVAFRDPHEAEDTAQQVFMRVFETLDTYERRSQPFRAWLFAIARNHAVSHLRKHCRVEVEDPERINSRREHVAAEDPELESLDWIADRDLMLFVERLPTAQRQVLAMRFLLDLPVKEVARLLGRSTTDVSVLQSRGLRFLRDRLTAIGRAPERRDPRSRTTAGVRKAHILRRRRYVLLE